MSLSSFATLPDEILLMIVQYLPPSDLCNCALLSVRMRRVVTCVRRKTLQWTINPQPTTLWDSCLPYWAKLASSDHPRTSYGKGFSSVRVNVHCNNMCCPLFDCWAFLAAAFDWKKITTLHLEHGQGMCEHEVSFLSMSKLPVSRVRHLILSDIHVNTSTDDNDTNFNELVRLMPRLERLQLGGWMIPRCIFFKKMLSFYQSTLQSLKISVYDSILSDILQSIPHVKDLHITTEIYCSYIFDTIDVPATTTISVQRVIIEIKELCFHIIKYKFLQLIQNTIQTLYVLDSSYYWYVPSLVSWFANEFPNDIIMPKIKFIFCTGDYILFPLRSAWKWAPQLKLYTLCRPMYKIRNGPPEVELFHVEKYLPLLERASIDGDHYFVTRSILVLWRDFFFNFGPVQTFVVHSCDRNCLNGFDTIFNSRIYRKRPRKNRQTLLYVCFFFDPRSMVEIYIQRSPAWWLNVIPCIDI